MVVVFILYLVSHQLGNSNPKNAKSYHFSTNFRYLTCVTGINNIVDKCSIQTELYKKQRTNYLFIS